MACLPGFEYIPSLYTLSDELRSETQAEDVEATGSCGCATFIARTQLRASSTKKVTRPSLGRPSAHRSSDAARYPYPENPYEAADDLAARTRWLHTNMFVGGPWCLGPDGIPEEADAGNAAGMVETLQRMVSNDWPELEVMVQVTDDGLISISFPMDGLNQTLVF